MFVHTCEPGGLTDPQTVNMQFVVGVVDLNMWDSIGRSGSLSVPGAGPFRYTQIEKNSIYKMDTFFNIRAC